MSAYGTKQTWLNALTNVRFGGKADITPNGSLCRLMTQSGHGHCRSARRGLSGFHLHGEQLTIVPRGKRIAETRTTVIFCRCV